MATPDWLAAAAQKTQETVKARTFTYKPHSIRPKQKHDGNSKKKHEERAGPAHKTTADIPPGLMDDLNTSEREAILEHRCRELEKDRAYVNRTVAKQGEKIDQLEEALKETQASLREEQMVTTCLRRQSSGAISSFSAPSSSMGGTSSPRRNSSEESRATRKKKSLSIEIKNKAGDANPLIEQLRRTKSDHKAKQSNSPLGMMPSFGDYDDGSAPAPFTPEAKLELFSSVDSTDSPSTPWKKPIFDISKSPQKSSRSPVVSSPALKYFDNFLSTPVDPQYVQHVVNHQRSMAQRFNPNYTRSYSAGNSPAIPPLPKHPDDDPPEPEEYMLPDADDGYIDQNIPPVIHDSERFLQSLRENEAVLAYKRKELSLMEELGEIPTLTKCQSPSTASHRAQDPLQRPFRYGGGFTGQTRDQEKSRNSRQSMESWRQVRRQASQEWP